METLIYHIAKNCDWLKSVNEAYRDQCEDNLDKLEQMLPSGSGIDAGTKIDREKSGKDKVIINFEYHHLNGDGYYDGWTQHKLIVKPTFMGIEMNIQGRDRNDTKDYLYDLFDTVLNEQIEFN